mmetsp:Transcript_10150/g.27813  ORF Transcript_10150/g.27813 Transcript_10150/m.27813 type:complete len:225 (+) Transcript_10150:225-899(+)
MASTRSGSGSPPSPAAFTTRSCSCSRTPAVANAAAVIEGTEMIMIADPRASVGADDRIQQGVGILVILMATMRRAEMTLSVETEDDHHVMKTPIETTTTMWTIQIAGIPPDAIVMMATMIVLVVKVGLPDRMRSNLMTTTAARRSRVDCLDSDSTNKMEDNPQATFKLFASWRPVVVSCTCINRVNSIMEYSTVVVTHHTLSPEKGAPSIVSARADHVVRCCRS